MKNQGGMSVLTAEGNASSGLVTTLTTTFLDWGLPLEGPFSGLSFVAYETSANAEPANLTAPGAWRLVARKYKSEVSTMAELWVGLNIPGASAASADVVVTLANTASAMLVVTTLIEGAVQGVNALSRPAWQFHQGTGLLKFDTPDEPAPVTVNPVSMGGAVAQATFVVYQDAGQFNPLNCITRRNVFTGTREVDFCTAGFTNTEFAPELARGRSEISVSLTYALGVSVNLYTDQHFDAKEGTPPEPEHTPEEEMRYKERIADLERELESRNQQHVDLEADFVATNREISSERDSLRQALADTQNAASSQIAALQTELATVRNELQQTLAALPAHIQQAAEQHFQQRLAQLLDDPATLRDLLMQRAQSANDPRTVFSALQGMQQIG